MNDAWIGLIGALAGTVIGGLVTYLGEHSRFRRERHWDWLSLLRTKFEEIGQVTEELRQYYVSVAAAAFKHSKGLESNLARIEEAFYPLPRLIVLIRFYAPELESELGALASQEKAVKSALSALMAKPRLDDGRFNEVALNELLSAQKEFDQHCAALLRRLTEEAKRLVPKWPRWPDGK